MNVAWKIALYNLVYHQLPLIQHCSIFYKKNAFQSTKILGEFNGKICSECISYNLEFHNFPGDNPCTLPSPPPPPTRGENPPLRLSPTCACGARFMPPALNSPPTL